MIGWRARSSTSRKNSSQEAWPRMYPCATGACFSCRRTRVSRSSGLSPRERGIVFGAKERVFKNRPVNAQGPAGVLFPPGQLITTAPQKRKPGGEAMTYENGEKHKGRTRRTFSLRDLLAIGFRRRQLI